MKSFSTYHLNTPTTVNGHSISITTTIYGSEDEIKYIKKNCEEVIGAGLAQEYSCPFTSQFRGMNAPISSGKVVPDVLHGWRYEE